jgi:hypothetical protein
MKRILVFIFVLGVTPQAHAVFELHGFAGLAFNESQSLNRQLASSGITQIFLTGLYGFDARINLPGTPVGLGARYDWQGIKVGKNDTGTTGSEFEVSSKRVAALAHLRFVDGVGYMGLVGTFGITHTPTVLLKQGSNQFNYDSGKTTSGTIGLESGLNLMGLKLGAEAGYQDYLIREITGSSGQANFDINFCGFYAIGHFGFEF